MLASDPDIGDVVMSRFATMIAREFTVPDLADQLRRIHRNMHAHDIQGMNLTLYRMSLWLKSPRPYLMLIGFALFLGFWYLAVEVWKLPRFREMPGITAVIKEWLSRDPTYGLSLYTDEYYKHIWVSVWRVTRGVLPRHRARRAGRPLSRLVEEVQGIRVSRCSRRCARSRSWRGCRSRSSCSSRPSRRSSSSRFSPRSSRPRSTRCSASSRSTNRTSGPRIASGASKSQVFRHVILPGALPFIFTGLQISIGVSWFSLVAAEMVSGQYGLGYVINTSYTMVRYPTIVIGMITLGAVGYVTSAMVRMVGDYLMQWRTRELALGGR